MAETVIVTPAPPPRLSGNPEQDQVALNQWLWDFYNAQKSVNDALSGAAAFDASAFDPGDLPDPATSNVAQAQDTANQAYILAASAKSDAAAALAAAVAITEDWVAGQITVSGTDTTAVHTFATAQDDTSYLVHLTCIGTTGAPAVDAVIITDIAKATDDFTITVNAAPGAGKTSIFDFLVYRL